MYMCRGPGPQCPSGPRRLRRLLTRLLRSLLPLALLRACKLLILLGGPRVRATVSGLEAHGVVVAGVRGGEQVGAVEGHEVRYRRGRSIDTDDAGEALAYGVPWERTTAVGVLHVEAFFPGGACHVECRRQAQSFNLVIAERVMVSSSASHKAQLKESLLIDKSA